MTVSANIPADSKPVVINGIHETVTRDAPQEDFSTRILSRLREIPCAGIALALFSGIIFTMAGFIVKLIPKVNPIQIVVSRSIVQLVVFGSIMFYTGMEPMGAKGERMSLFLRGFFGFLEIAPSYVAYRMIPLADASTIIFSAPVYVSVFACIILKEECGIFQTFTIGMTIAGVLLISKPTFLFGMDHESYVEIALRMEGIILAFIASMCGALTYVMMRRLQKTTTAVSINWFSIMSIIMGIFVLAIICNFFEEEAGMLAEGVGVPATWEEIGWVIANGLCAVVGQLCVTVALKIEEAGLVSLARTIDIVMAFLFQAVFLHNEVIHWTSIIGAVVVCIGVCVSALRRWLRGKPGKCNTLWLILNCGVRRQDQEENLDEVKKQRNASGSCGTSTS